MGEAKRGTPGHLSIETDKTQESTLVKRPWATGRGMRKSLQSENVSLGFLLLGLANRFESTIRKFKNVLSEVRRQVNVALETGGFGSC